jgi:hypothetical protein
MDRSPRLAELVVHLTGCDPKAAVEAVAHSMGTAPQSVDDALVIVARAMCALQQVDLREAVDLRESRAVHSQ